MKFDKVNFIFLIIGIAATGYALLPKSVTSQMCMYPRGQPFIESRKEVPEICQFGWLDHIDMRICLGAQCSNWVPTQEGYCKPCEGFFYTEENVQNAVNAVYEELELNSTEP